MGRRMQQPASQPASSLVSTNSPDKLSSAQASTLCKDTISKAAGHTGCLHMAEGRGRGAAHSCSPTVAVCDTTVALPVC